MFIRKPYDINSHPFRNDEYLEYEDISEENFHEKYKENSEERIMPPFFQPPRPGQGPGGPPPRPGQGPGGQPPRPGQGPGGQPPRPGQGPGGQPPRPGQGPGGQPPRPGQGPGGQPPRPGQGPGGQPPRPGHPPGPPPTKSPMMPLGGPQQQFISQGSLRPCRFQFVYIWLSNRNSFWAWLTNVDRRAASGFRWNGRMWVYFAVALDRIIFFECYGFGFRQQLDNGMLNLKTQVLSPSEFSLEYPVIDGIGNEDVVARINDEIINVLNAMWLNAVLIPEQVDFVKVESSYEVPLNSNGLISIVLSLYTQVKDSNQGNTLFASVTANTNTGEVYDFNNLFNPNMNYPAILSNIAMMKAREMNVELIAPYEGITDPQRYYLTPDSLVLYYQVDEYTPGTSGLFRISIPYSEISNLLYPGNPVNSLA